jgi:phosphoribosylanthranilate isomerase
VFVKICGITTADALAAAVDAGADAVGFVFATSPREIDAERAAELCQALPRSVGKVAVMHHPDAAAIDAVLAVFEPEWLQTDAEDLAAIELPAGCRPLPVLRNGRPPGEPLPDLVVFEGTVSGTGATADWDEARRLAAMTRLILAGGLSADNVGAAIASVRPWGVDVSTGVESSRGIKDPGKIAEFVARVRALESDT